MALGVTKKQSDLLDFIKQYVTQHGVSPSFDEMADYMGIKSRGNIHRYLEALTERGLIRRDQKFRRSLVVIDHTAEMAFFETLPSGIRHIIRTIAMRERRTNESVMREWIREYAENFRTPYVEQLSA